MSESLLPIKFFQMNLLQMSVSGALLIGAVVLLRALALNRLPKRTFCLLWDLALLRLLLPFAVSSPLNFPSLLNRAGGRMPVLAETVWGKLTLLFSGNAALGGAEAEGSLADGAVGGMAGAGSGISWLAALWQGSLGRGASGPGDAGQRASWTDALWSDTFWPGAFGGTETERWVRILWLAGLLLLAGYFAAAYLHARRRFAESLPVENGTVKAWLEAQSFQRIVTVRQSEYISSPLTYGLLRPVILLPGSGFWKEALRDNVPRKTASENNAPRKDDFADGARRKGVPESDAFRNNDFVDGALREGGSGEDYRREEALRDDVLGGKEGLELILTHEGVHIHRMDGLTKLLLTAALCLHWFNPLVWVMYALFNRDMELACDESVIRQFGPSFRSVYANILIGLEEKRGKFRPLCNYFSENAMEERIVSIMKTKKLTCGAIIASVVLLVGIAVFFGTSAMAEKKEADGPLEGSGNLAALILDISEEGITVDPLEYLTDADEERKQELIAQGVIVPERDLQDGLFFDGYFIYNPDQERVVLPLGDSVAFDFVDWYSQFFGSNVVERYHTENQEEFQEYLKQYEGMDPQYRPPYLLTYENGRITGLTEIWIN